MKAQVVAFGLARVRACLCALGLATLIFTLGCGSQPTAQPVSQIVVEEKIDDKPVEPAVVELFDAKGRIDDANIFWFDVKYRFTKGAPRQHYLMTINFPGTKNAGVKTIEAWELKSEGQIKDGVELQDSPITSYEFTFSEAESPMTGYHQISNKLTAAWPPETEPKPDPEPTK